MEEIQNGTQPKDVITCCRERLTNFLPNFIEIALAELKSYEIGDEDVGYYSHAIQYNLQGGKLIRGTLVVSTMRLGMGECTTDHLWHQALVLGWCVELLQTAFLVADDVMDRSIIRRSHICWYLVPTIGVANAVNDTMFFYTLTHRIISSQFKDSAHLLNILDLFNKVSMTTILGQHMDTYDAMDDSLFDSATAATELYHRICKNKTSYYTFYLPIQLGMILCNIDKDSINFSKLESASSMLGHLFQAQDDFLDCYGDPKFSGKEGTDIQTKKCTWLLATALHICNDEQFKQLKENIGKNSPENVESVKMVYNDLKLPQLFKAYSQELRNKIQR
ncbi:farnesyl diphosphate synthase [Babesia gibsoni]|uniref:Farnesyl diphosphate synthase n=1 Tax=Babesia gibsoni TaxID=33632 RepID=A0AAD8UV13_BABGI|nr:farnesyl diphosphate synthase [Babesia gibsoni]